MTIANISNAAAAPSPQSLGAPNGATKAQLAQAAKAFEAIFLRQMIGAMRSASLGDGLTDSSASDQFRDMADSRTADSMAETGKFGIAELLMRQFGGKSAAGHTGPGAALPAAAPKDDGA